MEFFGLIVFFSGKSYALDATDISKPPLWQFTTGTIVHFGYPVVANGKVYLTVHGGQTSGRLMVFGLK